MSTDELKQYLFESRIQIPNDTGEVELRELALKASETATTDKSRKGPPKGEFCSCWAMLLPEIAPEWYVRRIGGYLGGDCHIRPAPEGSLYLLGHIGLSVPNLADPCTVIQTGLGFSRSPQSSTKEVHLSAGPSQIILHHGPSKPADVWPGEIRVWVDNIQTTYDFMGAVDGELNTRLLYEYNQGINGGEFSMKIYDAYKNFFFVMTEAPRGRTRQVKAIGCETKGLNANAVAFSDVSIKTKTRAETQLLAMFYKEFFNAAITVMQYSSLVHFSPDKALHQTLSFVESPGVIPSNIGYLCFYMKEKPAFHISYIKCLRAGIIESPASWEEAQEKNEFVITGMVDSASKTTLMKMRNVVRLAAHKDCLVAAN